MDKSIEDHLKGQAQLILRSLGSGDIENGYRQTEADALSKYPNADQLLLWRSYIYIACSLMEASSQWTDDQKFERLIQLIRLYHEPPPTEMNESEPSKDSLTGQSNGFAAQVRCRRTAAQVICNAIIVNQDPNREVAFPVNQTKVFDSASQDYPATEATIAGHRGSGYQVVRAKLLQGRPAQAIFRFDGIALTDRELSELDIHGIVGFEAFVVECAGSIHLSGG